MNATSPTTTTPTCPRCLTAIVRDGMVLLCGAFSQWHDDGRVGDPPCDYREVRTSFSVPEQNLPRLKRKVEELQRRAKRLGTTAPSIAVGTSEEREVQRHGAGKWMMTFFHVDVFGVAPRISGWTFGATVDHDGDENIFRGVAGKKGEDGRDAGLGIPTRYRTAGPVCEHCKVRRTRSETFLLRSDEGEWKQVGRSCLKDFLGHPNPSALAYAAEFLAEAMDEAGECEVDAGFGGFGGSSADPEIVYFLSYAALAVRRFGWTPRSAERDGEATADIVLQWIYAPPKERKTVPKPEAEDEATANAALEWARSLGGDDPEALSEFQRNLRAASKRAAVGLKNAGITAYIIAGYLKAETSKRERAASEWVGEVGTRFGSGKGKKAIPGLVLTATHVFEREGCFGGQVRRSYINIMRDERGDAFKWSGSTCLEMGATYQITGTVKEHSAYRGTKQTLLTRCVCVRLETAAKKAAPAASTAHATASAGATADAANQANQASQAA